MMSRYNVWQNRQLMDIIDAIHVDELTKDRGAFFGSILGTLSHLLWGDMLWLNRFDPSAPSPDGGPAESVSAYADLADWRAERLRTDMRIQVWADKVTEDDLKENLTMFSRVLQAETSAEMAMCVPHFFNHQTHHRGQIHAMLTAAGYEAPVSDLFFMPKDL
jgi:uncharacterized damage-inducible protein DinB